jgi:hypothetical protein
MACVLLLAAVIFAAYRIYAIRHTAFDLICHATLIHHERHDNNPFIYKSYHTVVLRKDGTGYDQMNGEATIDNKPYTLNRTILFSYERHGNDRFLTLKVTGARISGADDVPQEAYRRYMSFVNTDSKRMVELTLLPSGDLLVNTALGPFFICAVK